MTVDEFACCEGVENVIEALFVGIQEEELAPEAFIWDWIFDAVIVGQDVEEMEIQLDNFGLE
jgi:hypothetical protein